MCSSTFHWASLLVPTDRLLHLCMWGPQTSSQPKARHICQKKKLLQTNVILLVYSPLKCCTSMSGTGPCSCFGLDLIPFKISVVSASSIGFIFTDRNRGKHFFIQLSSLFSTLKWTVLTRKHYFYTCKRTYSSKRLFYNFSAHSR